MGFLRPASAVLWLLILVGGGCAAGDSSPKADAPATPAARAANAPLEHTQAAPVVRSSSMSGQPSALGLGKTPPPARTPPKKAPNPPREPVAAPAKLAKKVPPAPASRDKGLHAAAPKNLNLDKSRLGQHGRFKISYQAQPAQPHSKRPQEWKLKVQNRSGKALTSARVRLAGSCPQSGQKLKPVSLEARNLGHGYYLAKGLVFSQPGWWVVTVEVTNGKQRDQAQFNLLAK